MLANILNNEQWTSHALRRAWLQRLIALVLSLGLFLSPVGTSFGNAGGASGHDWSSVVTEVGLEADHGHDHDDDHGTGTRLGHSHGHDPADHSHNAACAAPDGEQAFTPLDRAWFWLGESRLTSAGASGIERPPRSTVAF
jgi:hypothetical protein